jgi:hypothetical protein
MKIYTFKVALDSHKRTYRLIEICGNQTLDAFHEIVFDAFDRDEEHLYSFYLTRKPIKTPRRRYDFAEYTSSEAIEHGYADPKIHDAYSTDIEQLKLKLKDKLYYLFDFGDSWWHEITLLSIKDLNTPNNKGYPKIVKKVGKSPPQYGFEVEDF